MSSTTYAGLEFTWTGGTVSIESPNRTMTISAGPVASHATPNGGSTILSNLEIMGDRVMLLGISTQIWGLEDLALSFGSGGGDGTTLVGNLWIKSYNGSRPIANVNPFGEWVMYDGTAPRLRLCALDYNRDVIVEPGYGNYARGMVLVRAEKRDHGPGVVAGYLDRAGLVVLESVTGVRLYLWARHSAGVTELRADNTDPGADDAPATSKVLVSFP